MMRTIKFSIITIFLMAIIPVPVFAKAYTLPPQSLLVGADAGFFNDLGGRARISWLNISDDLPAGIHLALGRYHQTDPGNAKEARNIFINDAEGGQVDKYGTTWLLEVDTSYRLTSFRSMDIHATTGPRWAFYKAHFAYVGDNEEFDVKSNPFGWGIGAAGFVQFSKHFVFNVNLGFDYFFKSKFEAHGEYYYTPNGVDENPRTSGDTGEDYTYSDADSAVNQPRTEVKAFLGVSYLF